LTVISSRVQPPSFQALVPPSRKLSLGFSPNVSLSLPLIWLAIFCSKGTHSSFVLQSLFVLIAWLSFLNFAITMLSELNASVVGGSAS
jgi:hypothetical protein